MQLKEDAPISKKVLIWSTETLIEAINACRHEDKTERNERITSTTSPKERRMHLQLVENN